jgi:hypothetical protein
VNRLAQELALREERLIERERELDLRFKRTSAQATNDLDRYVLIVLGLLFALILLNLWLDHRVRERLARTFDRNG